MKVGTLTGTGLILSNSDPFFGTMMPTDCSTVTMSGELAGAVPTSSPAANYVLKVFKLVPSGANANPVVINELTCTMTDTSPTCAATLSTAGTVKASDILQVQVSGNQNFNWKGGLYASLSCKK